MREPERIPEIIALLHAAWAKSPDLRLGQLISILTHLGGWRDNDPFYVEDDVVILGLQKLFEMREEENQTKYA